MCGDLSASVAYVVDTLGMCRWWAICRASWCMTFLMGLQLAAGMRDAGVASRHERFAVIGNGLEIRKGEFLW